MELLLICIVALLIFISIKIAKLLTLSRKMVGYEPVAFHKYLNRKKHIQIDIWIPAQTTGDPLRIHHTVTPEGLITCLERSALASSTTHFDSLPKNYLVATRDLYISCHEQNSADSVALLTATELTLQGNLTCSERGFNVIVDQLSRGKSILLRINGRITGNDADDVRAVSQTFEIILDGEISGPRYFMESYEEYRSKADGEVMEKLSIFEQEIQKYVYRGIWKNENVPAINK